MVDDTLPDKGASRPVSTDLSLSDLSVRCTRHGYVLEETPRGYAVIAAEGDLARVADWLENVAEVDARERKALERFLALIVLASGPDRFTAMRLRREKGIEAAALFLEECTMAPDLTDDSEAWDVLCRSLDKIKMMADLISSLDSTATFMDGTRDEIGMTLLDWAIKARQAYNRVSGEGSKS